MTLLPLLTLLACPPAEPADSGADTDSAADSGDTDSAADTDSGADTDSAADSGVDTGAAPDCGEDGFCELVVTSVTLGYADPTDAHAITATPSGAYAIDVVDHHFADGCCPDASVVAVASLRNNRIEVSYSLTRDDCDCYTGLSLSYTLSGVPSGTFELAQGGATTTVTVE